MEAVLALSLPTDGHDVLYRFQQDMENPSFIVFLQSCLITGKIFTLVANTTHLLWLKG